MHPALHLAWPGAGPQAGVRMAAVAVSACLKQVGDLVAGEPEPLRRPDHPQDGDRFGRVEAVPAQAAVRLGEQAAALVVAQRL